MSKIREIPVLGVYHSAALLYNPKMTLPTIRDWSKVRDFLSGEWPKPDPTYDNISYYSGYELARFVEQEGKSQVAVIDTEYDSESKFLTLFGLGFVGSNHIYQFDYPHASPWARQQFANDLRELVLSQYPVVFQNVFADLPVLTHNFGIILEDFKQGIEDTMLSHGVLWSDWPHDLGFLESIYSSRRKLKHLGKTNFNLYNAGDVASTGDAWQGISKEFERDKLSERIYRDQSLSLVPLVLSSHSHGIRVHNGRVEEATRDYQERKLWANDVARAYTGYPINLGSDDQLKWWLYTLEGMPVQKNAKTKKPTVDQDAIAYLRNWVGSPFDADEESRNGLSVDEAIRRMDELEAHPLLEARVIYSEAEQILSHYLVPASHGERVYPQFKLHAQASGRWSTTNPPMAQLPSDLRDIVIPDEGERWIEFDWDQIELRLLAALAQDKPYLEAFAKGWDVHTLNACSIFNLIPPVNRLTPHDLEWREMVQWQGKDDLRRRFGKVFVYRLHYGGEPKHATDIPGAKQLNLDGKALVIGSKRYMKDHPAIPFFWEQERKKAFTSGEVRTFMGRRRRLLVDGQTANRLIYNHPMQGGVSDIFNTTAVRIWRECQPIRFVYGMHDSQKWGVSEDRYDEVKKKIQSIISEEWDVNGLKVQFPATFKD